MTEIFQNKKTVTSPNSGLKLCYYIDKFNTKLPLNYYLTLYMNLKFWSLKASRTILAIRFFCVILIILNITKQNRFEESLGHLRIIPEDSSSKRSDYNFLLFYILIHFAFTCKYELIKLKLVTIKFYQYFKEILRKLL